MSILTGLYTVQLLQKPNNVKI